MAERSSELSPAELEVLNVLWEAGPSTVRQIHGHLRRSGRQVAYTTVLTFLTRLEHKGVVASDKENMAYVYRPVLSRGKVRKTRLKNLVEQLYDGAAGELVLQLMKTQKFSPDEIEQLRTLVEQLDEKKKRGDRAVEG
ncbi:MAG TPA: BlaI/MecI/CopY family transcriptional regulator [Phycisphaerae bacterium]|nr:BlaI/MecI/CopY family transcriptional regulator [Phycisphaerae bacterium]